MPQLGSPPASYQITYFAPEDLVFDEHNPRLQGRGEGDTQEQILRTLWREYAVDEIALSIAANGFFKYEPMFVAKEEGRHVVIEGNRRLAAVRLLLDSAARSRIRATDLPEIKAEVREDLRALPVVLCSRAEIWRYVGFKHVNGPQQWDALAKAQYIAWVHNTVGVSLPDIATMIGDRHATVSRLYNALMALTQAESAGVWNRERRYHKRFFFSHLYTALAGEGYQKYLGMTSTRTTTSPAPVPKAKLPRLGELCIWIFGDKETNVPPLVRSQNPHLRELEEVIQNKNGVDALRSGLPLSVSLDIAKGDDRILREDLVGAKSTLQSAKARVVTGYQGETDVRKNAEDIFALAESILDEMQAIEARASQSSSRRRITRRSVTER